ncbi:MULTISPECIES: SHOCT domain-containing protein [Haloferax]|uniref:SHOCT domain-containing protein n=1 Tax=Haloferax marinum TaxID=2666143 RepID=A0A6A8G907_9EURY|nr:MULTISPECIES: SHOCT domain-containing protein [Haloferax]KAB1197976.1 SHOCT domain-containing protein [Haloferax sp. CBA1150]MRW97042.1 SHOCT domain-containing protein [Haloferax marinum]
MSSLDILRERGVGGFAHEHPLQFGLALGVILGGFALLNGGSFLTAFIWFFGIGSLIAVVYSYTMDFLSAARGRPNSQPLEDDTDPERALYELRERYARGQLTDEAFEDQVERLLETETLDSARGYASRRETERERAEA